MDIEGLDASATTLVLRTSKKFNFRQMLTVLDRVCAVAECPNAYDFVYMPWTKLAIVNFRTSDICRQCFRAFGSSNESSIRFVGQAVVQGLNENLVLFLNKSGPDKMNDPGAPRIFHNGQEVDMEEVLAQLGLFEAGRRAGSETTRPRVPPHGVAAPHRLSSWNLSPAEAGRISPPWMEVANEGGVNIRPLQEPQSGHPGNALSTSLQVEVPWLYVRGQHLVFDL